MYKISANELYHHGILGMKWGEQNGPPYPLGASQHSKKERSKGTSGWTRNAKQEVKSGRNKNSSKSSKSSSTGSKSKKSGLTDKQKKYKDRGYGTNASEIAARNERITKAILIGIGAVAVGYVGYKVGTRLGQDYCDKIIKSGAIIQNIGGNPNDTFTDHRFFATFNNKDKKLYFNKFAHERRFIFGDKEVFKNDIKVTKDIKRASVNNARKIFIDKMKNDSAFRKDVLDSIYPYYKQNVSSVEKAFTGKGNTKIQKQTYQKFNKLLGDKDIWKNGVDKSFYDTMSSKGYNAILDINDARLSGYKGVAKEPTIIFSDSLNKLSSTKISDADIVKHRNVWIAKYLATSYGKKIATITGGALAKNTIADNIAVNKYIKEHPNTKLSRNEIKKKINDGEL